MCLISWVAYHRGSRGSSAMVTSCLRGYFVVPKLFLVGISLAQSFFSWVFRGSKFFSREYFVGPRFFLVGISWVQNFLLWTISYFLVVGRMRKIEIEIYLRLLILFQINFNNCEFCLY